MKRRQTGLTIIEMITVLAVIVILIGLLIPAVNMVRRKAKVVQQRSQLAVINLALELWNEDFGDYPDSGEAPVGAAVNAVTYTGAQKLAEAMVGLDLRGYHPGSDLVIANGTNNVSYYNNDANGLAARKEPYLDLDKARVFKATSTAGNGEGLFDTLIASGQIALARDSLVLCDVFERFNVTYTYIDAGGVTRTEVARAGMPLLYFKAQDLGRGGTIDAIYDFEDNAAMAWAALQAQGKAGALIDEPRFFEIIRDPRTLSQAVPMPVKRDSYLLISAGPDGVYFTGDDVTNFN